MNRINRIRFGSFCSFCLILVFARAAPITIATYNIENYGPADRMTEGGYRKDYPKPESEKRALRVVICALKADVLVLQEMGNQPYLDELRRDLKSEGLDYPYSALASAADADRHIALLSKLPLKDVVTHADLEFAYFGAKEVVKRGMLDVTIMTSAGDLTLFAVHLKSRFTERPDDPLCSIRRAGEATAVRDAILKKFPNSSTASFLILGDCNDSKSSKALEHLMKRGKTEVAVLLPAADSRGDTWTHDYRHEDTYTRVDHILVSPALRSAVDDSVAKIFDREGVRLASDHRPVIVTIDLAKK